MNKEIPSLHVACYAGHTYPQRPVSFTWQEIEIAGRPKPKVRLSGRTLAFAEKIGAGKIDLSMTHSRGMAAAVAVVEVDDPKG